MSEIDDILNGAPEHKQGAYSTKSIATEPTSEIEQALQNAPAPARGFGGWARDIAATAVKGAIAVPEAVVGLADIPTGGAVGKFLENEDGALGFRPKQAKEFVNEWHSDATKEAQRKFQEADGLGGKLQSAIENPSVIATAVGESIPSMLAGGVAARGLMAATRLGQMGAGGAALAGAAGEGAMMAGSQAESIRQETQDGLLTPGQSALAAGTGLIGGAVGALGGKVAQKFGIGDAETMLAQGANGIGADAVQQSALKSIPKAVVQGAITEGFLEELPQSVAEQVLQNLALDKDWTDGVDTAAVLGVLSGGAMGGGAAGLSGVMSRGVRKPEQPVQDQKQESPDQNTPSSGIDRIRKEYEARLSELFQQEAGEPQVAQSTPPDGRAILKAQEAAAKYARDAEMAANRAVQSPDDEIFQSTGATVPRSVQMGLNPAAGPMSAAAAAAVDTGAADRVQEQAAKASEKIPASDLFDRKDAGKRVAHRVTGTMDGKPLTTMVMASSPEDAMAAVAKSSPGMVPVSAAPVTEPATPTATTGETTNGTAPTQAVQSQPQEAQAAAELGQPLTDTGTNMLGRGADPLQSIIQSQADASRAAVKPPRGILAKKAAADAKRKKANEQAAEPAAATPESAAAPAPAVRGTGVSGGDQPQPLDALSNVQDQPQGTNVGGAAAKPVNREQAIRDAWRKEPRTIGKWTPISVEAEGQKADMLVNQKRAGGDKDGALHVVNIRMGKMLKDMEREPIAYTFRLTADNRLVEEGIPTVATPGQIAAWKGAGFALDDKQTNVKNTPQGTAGEAKAPSVKESKAEGSNAASNAGVPDSGAGAGVRADGVKRKPSEESQQDKSIREWTENYDRIANTDDLSTVDAKDIVRAIAWASRRKQSEARKGWDGGEPNKSLLASLDAEIARLKAEESRREKPAAPKANDVQADGVNPETVKESLTVEKQPRGVIAKMAEQKAKARDQEPFEHAGLKIRTTRTKVGDEVVDGWLVQSPENAEREARGERQLGGDRIVETREQAIKTAEKEAKRYADSKAYMAELEAKEKADRDAEEARKAANRGKSIVERRIDAILDKPGRFPVSAGLGLGTKREAMDKAIEQDRLVTEVMIDDTAAKKRDQDAVDAVRRAGYILGASNENIPVVKKGLEAQARLKEGKYRKPEYRVYQGRDRNGSFFEITKTEYDYVQKVKASQPAESKPDQETKAKAEPKAENLPEGWDTLKNGYTGLPVYRFNQGAGQPFAVVTRTEIGYEVQIRNGDKLVTSRNMPGAAKFEALDTATQMLGEATMATHKDPGEKAEPATKAVVNEAMKTAAKNEDTKPSEMYRRLQQLSARANRKPYTPLTEEEFKAVVDAGLATGKKWATGKLNTEGYGRLAQLEADETESSNARADAEDLIAEGLPFKASAVDQYGLAVPEGYVRQGEMFAKVAPAAQAEQEAKQATDDRDTFTLNRLNRETGSMEPVTFKRGEYVEVTLIGSDKKGYGEIDGISQARREFSVNGLWHTMGAAYKAERPAAPVRKDMEPLSSVIDKMNAKNGEGLTEADRVPEQKPASKTPTVDRHEALMKSVREGKAAAEQFKAAFESLVENKAAVIAELETKTKAELLKAGGYFIQMRYANEKKGEVIDAIYRQMVGNFVLGETLSYGMGKGAFEAAVRRHVEATDDAKLEQYAKDRQAAIAEAQAERAAKAAAMDNPQTLADFKAIIAKHIGEGKSAKEAFLSLTPEQRIQFDTLAAESTREAREARKRERKTEVRAAGQTTGGEIISTKHTRDGYDLFVVQLADRLSREDYNTVLASAKKLGGWYSAFRVKGAVPGFQFKDKASAEAFLKLAGGDTSDAQAQAEQRRDAFDDDRSQTVVERLRTMADKLTEQAAGIEGADRKTNTARRARFAVSALKGAAEMKAKANTMRNIAQAIEGGGAKFLDAVRTKSQVDFLTGMVATAKNNELRAKYPSYADQEKRKGEPATAETADFAEFPAFTAYRSDLASLGRQLLEVDGTKKLGQRLMSVADDVSDAYLEFARQPANLLNLSRFSFKRGEKAETAIFASRDLAEKSIRRSGLTGKAIVLAEKRGVNRIILSPSEAINAGIWTGDGDKRITLSTEFGNELVEAIGRRGNKSNKLTVPWQFQNAYDRRKALSRMGIETPSEYRSALREFIGLQESAIANKVREMELAMVGKKNDGLDFFPTPAEVADQMVEAADIESGMLVLEPSGGMGHIADRIRAAGAEPDVGEISEDRRELLEEKGYNIVARDFMEFTAPAERGFTFGDLMRAPDGTVGILRGQGGMGSDRVRLVSDEAEPRELGKFNFSELEGVERRGSESGYDRIIMNPPFSNRRDAEHVQHAYKLLKPGGRIVAIMGEGVFFGKDKKAQDFRDWLDSVGGTNEKLPAGSFMDQSLPVNTGVNARMVVIDKPAGDAVTQDEDDAFMGEAESPVFYSALRREIDGLSTKSAPAVGWNMALQGLVKNGKVKADELEWTGISEWLKLQTGKVSKDDVLAYLDANGVQVTETVLGDEARETAAERWMQERARLEFAMPFDSLDEADQDYIRGKAEDANIMPEKLSKYSQYTLPGGSNYREVLLTLPMRSADAPKGEVKYDPAGDAAYPWAIIVNGKEVNRSSDEATAPDILQEEIDRATKKAGYRSSHWDQKNVLAHIRVNDRTDAQGRKTLFVEEIQSDFGQDIKKKGMASKVMTEAQRAAKLAEAKALTAGIRQRSNADRAAGLEQISDETLRLNTADSIRAGELMRELEDDKAAALANTGKLPRAPFVDKTDKWLALSLKRIMKMAVDGSYDAVAFVNGEQSAERYDLSKQVEVVKAAPLGNGKYNIAVFKERGQTPILKEDDVTIDRIEDLIGKEMAKKIADAPTGKITEFSGDGLKVGGEGMKAFYDKIVPAAVKDVLKKVGGGQMESVEIDAGSPSENRWLAFNHSIRGSRKEFDSKQQAENYAKSQGWDDADTDISPIGMSPQPGFSVTDSMREKVAGGLPLFAGSKSKSRGAGTPIDRAVMSMAGDGKSGNEILKYIANASRSPYRRQLAKALIATGANPDVSMGGDMGGGAGFKFLAKYSRKNHEVTLSEAAADRAEQIFLHETTHAATLLALDKRGLFATQMNRLYESAKKQGGADGQYGMKNVGEFVAEAFTNPTFQKTLKGMKAENSSLWERFVNIVRRILGMEQRHQDMLSAVLDAGVQVMRENMPLRAARSFRAEDGPVFAGRATSPVMTEEQAIANGFTMKAYRGVSKASPFNDTGTTWLTTSREVAEVYAEEVMGYDDPGVIEVMVNPSALPRHDASRLTDEQREQMQADGFGNPQAIGIYDRSDDHPLGGSRRNVTVIHAPMNAVAIIGDAPAFAGSMKSMPENQAPGPQGDTTSKNAPTSDKSGAFAGLPQGGMQERAVRAVTGSPEPAQSGFEAGSEAKYATAPAHKKDPWFRKKLLDPTGRTSEAELASRIASLKATTEREAAGKTKIKSGIAKLDLAMNEHYELIQNAHKNKVLNFKPLPLDEFSSRVSLPVYKSGSYGKSKGSEYRLVLVNGEPAYAREADHWGVFNTTEVDRFGERVDVSHDWRLDGVEETKWTDKTRYAGYVLLKDIPGYQSAPDTDGAYFGIADAVEQIKAFDVKTAQKNTWEHYRGMALQFLGRRQIVDLYADELPQLESYNDIVQQMDSEKNDTGAEADRVAQDWGSLKNGMDRKLAELMHDATLAKMDPDKPMPAGYFKRDYDALKARFDALSPEAKDLYRKARDMYFDHYKAVQQAIKDRVERSEMSEGQKRKMMADLDDKLFKELKGVYFPLARFGQYVIVVKDANGEVVNVTRSETVKEAEQARKELQKAFPAHMGNTVGKVLKQAEFNAGRDAVGKGFMADLMNALDEKGIDDELRDTVAQLYLSSLPDLSWAKHGIHRKGTPGFSQDARRAFAQNMFHGARYLAKLRHADRLQDLLIEMQDHIKAYEGVDEYNSVQAQQVVDEMVKRHEWLMNPNASPVSTALTSFGFLFHMGLSPASAMVNLTQTALVAYPQMSAKWGFNKSAAALLKASEETVRAKNDLSKTLKGDELDAFNQAVKDGTIDVTMAHDLAGIAQGEDQGVMWKVRPVMRWASFMFHHAEKFNRQATFLAAYRLAKEANPAATQSQLYEQAKQATYDGHFDYSACVDDATEILTESGWKRRADLRAGDIAIATDDAGKAVLSKVLAVNVYEGEKEVIEFKSSRKFSMVLTPNHDAIIQSYNSRAKKWQAIKKVRADELKNSHFIVRAPLAAIDRDGVGLGEDMASLLGWIAAEGWYAKYRNCKQATDVRIGQSDTHNPEYVSEIRSLLQRLGGEFKEYTYQRKRDTLTTFVLRRSLGQKVQEAMPQKVLTSELVQSMSTVEMRAFIMAFLKGDGTKYENGKAWAVGQKNGANLDLLQAMATMCGMRSTLSPVNGNGLAALYVVPDDTGARSHVRPLEQIRRTEPLVWCPTTEHGTWIARRNGAVFVTGNSNRARIMQGNWQRVIFLFKNYAQHMVYALSRNAYLSVKALDPKERAQARKTLGGILAAHAAAAGVLGLPIVGPLLTVASWIGGDDDEPWDAEVAMQNAMAELLGPKAAEVMARGLSRLTPFDLSGRVALNKLILPDVQEGLEGKEWAESAMAAALGPVAGIGVNVARGVQKITEGDYLRGMEDMMPTALRGPLKALRYGSEGAIDKTGITITDEVGAAGVAGQALGLSPSQVRRDTERRSAIYAYDRALTERRSVLMRMFADAQMNGDTETAQEVRQDIAAFNEKNPTRRITVPNLMQSVRNRQRRIDQAEDGVYLPKNRRDALDSVTF